MTANKDLQEQVSLDGFLEQEVARLGKKTRLTWIGGIGVLVVLVVYMSGVLGLVRGMLEPRMLARMIALHVEESMPTVLYETEQGIEKQAPVVANAISEQIMQAIPRVREEAEKQIDLACDEMLPLLRDEANETIRAYVAAHAEELDEIYSSARLPEFGEAMVDAVVNDLAVELDARLTVASGHNLAYVGARALEMMQDINGQLVFLLDKDSGAMTRSERLQRRLIVTWIHVFQEALGKSIFVGQS